MSPEELEWASIVMRVWRLPKEPTEESLWEARELVRVYAHRGEKMPEKLLIHLDKLLEG